MAERIQTSIGCDRPIGHMSERQFLGGAKSTSSVSDRPTHSLTMWRMEADAFFGDRVGGGRVFRQRVNPFEDFNDADFFRKYRFTKPIFTELLDILQPGFNISL